MRLEAPPVHAPLEIARILNHSSPAITERYMHRTDDRLNALAAKMDRMSAEWLSGLKEALASADEKPEVKPKPSRRLVT